MVRTPTITLDVAQESMILSDLLDEQKRWGGAVDAVVADAGGLEAYARSMAVHEALNRMDGRPEVWLDSEMVVLATSLTCRVGLRWQSGLTLWDPDTQKFGRPRVDSTTEAMLWGERHDLLDVRYRNPGQGWERRWRVSTWQVIDFRPSTTGPVAHVDDLRGMYLLRWR